MRNRCHQQRPGTPHRSRPILHPSARPKSLSRRLTVALCCFLLWAWKPTTSLGRDFEGQRGFTMREYIDTNRDGVYESSMIAELILQPHVCLLTMSELDACSGRIRFPHPIKLALKRTLFWRTTPLGPVPCSSNPASSHLVSSRLISYCHFSAFQSSHSCLSRLSPQCLKPREHVLLAALAAPASKSFTNLWMMWPEFR